MGVFSWTAQLLGIRLGPPTWRELDHFDLEDRDQKLPEVKRSHIECIMMGARSSRWSNDQVGDCYKEVEEYFPNYNSFYGNVEPSAFATFLVRYQTLPTSIAVDCSSILHRIVLYLGAFPFRPAYQDLKIGDYRSARIFMRTRGEVYSTFETTMPGPGAVLVQGTFSIYSGDPKFNAEFIKQSWGLTNPHDDEDPEQHPDKVRGMDSWHRVLFQTLASPAVGSEICCRVGEDHVDFLNDMIYKWYVHKSRFDDYSKEFSLADTRTKALSFLNEYSKIDEFEIQAADLVLLIRLIVSISVEKESIADVNDVANCLIFAFTLTPQSTITWDVFRRVVEKAMPNAFEGLIHIFDSAFCAGYCPGITHPELKDTLILNDALVNQLSFFLPGKWQYFARSPYKAVYSRKGADASLSSFRDAVLNCKASTILLVAGIVTKTVSPAWESMSTLVDDDASERTVAPGDGDSQVPVIYGAYIPCAWKDGSFGSATNKLFQLSPTHDVYHGAEGTDHAWLEYDESDASAGGVGFGSRPPSREGLHKSGPISLTLSSNLRRGEFIRSKDAAGSCYQTGVAPLQSEKDVVQFSVDAIEVWSF